MGITSVGVVRPTAQRQEKREEDPLDKIMKGVQIANGVLGIAGGVQGIQQRSAEASMRDAQQRRLDRGLDLQERGLDIKERELGKTSAPKTQLITRQDESGKTVSEFVVPREGLSFTPPGEEKKPDFSPKDQRDFSFKLNREYRDAIEKNDKFISKVEKIDKIIPKNVEKMSGTAQVTLINQFQRLIDDAVVRSDDVNLIRESQSLKDRMASWVENLQRGVKIGDQQVKEMKRMSYALVEPELERLESLSTDFAAMATKANIDPEDVLGTINDRFERLRTKVDALKEADADRQTIDPATDAIEAEMRRRGLK